jgi:hypothetical protein
MLRAKKLGDYATVLLPDNGVDRVTITDGSGGLIEIKSTQLDTVRRELTRAAKEIRREAEHREFEREWDWEE